MLKGVNRKIGLILFLLSAGYLYMSFQLPTYPYIPVDADAVPKALGWVLLVLSIALFFTKDNDTEEQKAKRHIPKKDVMALLGVLGLLIIYIFLFEIVGFILMTTLFVFFCSWFLGYKKHWVNAIVSIVFPVFLYSIFVFLLQINLPQGILPI
ncbi:tripartite tricarboxylate transporter TctB family protein [Filobacillus milosensis]|uniref:Tripartite tricarboxylate transporter TctB family protein n=1 Tax=Filobacillus milosensis TaxID=94137 RepID=A0A4Y8IIU2_9BACI|nr:tripartite tricarboxylate transporter TctB family protein [Filobacillus milosensis]TFB19602.1 tripartite tricarboxylate transporter TctB family protein [Filobacillus milosensis]